VAIFSAFRLARFNIDEKQRVDFIGLPTPANALFISSLIFLYDSPMNFVVESFMLPVISILFSLLLVAPLRMFSLKVSRESGILLPVKIVFIILSILLLIFLRQAGIPVIIAAYIIISVFLARKMRDNETGQQTF
jgi:CDP-diacylglycerol--serine O-phosphatidyltransferase